jgi:hypothetical protein
VRFVREKCGGDEHVRRMQGSQVLLKLMSEEGLESWTQKSVRCFLIAPDCAPVNDTLACTLRATLYWYLANAFSSWFCE